MPLRAALFDLDDTLHDKSATVRTVAEAQYAAANLSNHGLTLGAWTSRCVALNNERIEKTEVFSRLADEFNLGPTLRDHLREDFDANLGKSAQAFAGAIELLRDCRRLGLKIGIVTNGRDRFQRSKIAGIGMDGLVDSIVTSEAFGSKKPDHRIFLACLRELAVVPTEAAFVGDDFTADMEPSLALGMRAVWKSSKTSDLVAYSSDDLAQIHAYLRSAV